MTLKVIHLSQGSSCIKCWRNVHCDAWSTAWGRDPAALAAAGGSDRWPRLTWRLQCPLRRRVTRTSWRSRRAAAPHDLVRRAHYRPVPRYEAAWLWTAVKSLGDVNVNGRLVRRLSPLVVKLVGDTRWWVTFTSFTITAVSQCNATWRIFYGSKNDLPMSVSGAARGGRGEAAPPPMGGRPKIM